VSLQSWQLICLFAATIAMGLMAGVFGDWAHTIMRGLHETDDRTFVRVFQALDRAILRPLFMVTFAGALGLTVAATALHVQDGTVLPWVVAASGFYLATVVITTTIHIPLNRQIVAAGDPDQITDPAAVRDAFHETRWAAWNTVRAVTTTAAFGCLAWALVLH
jgi:uncharacterized membrane protein